MMKLFGSFISRSGAPSLDDTKVRYTRSGNQKERERPLQSPGDPSQVTRQKGAPQSGRRHVPCPTALRKGGVDETAQLHSDAHISVSVLRKALPLRFAFMD